MLTSLRLAYDNYEYDSSVVDKNGYTTHKVILNFRFISRNENKCFFFCFFFFCLFQRMQNKFKSRALQRERERPNDGLKIFPFLFVIIFTRIRVFYKTEKLIQTRKLLLLFFFNFTPYMRFAFDTSG